MATSVSVENAVSLYEELLAYEYLYSQEGTSRAKMSKLFEKHGGLPSVTFKEVIGLIMPDDYIAVAEYVCNRIGNFSVLVDGTPQFPSSLRSERNPLPVFYYRGNIGLIDTQCVSVVGTRNPSERGKVAASRIAKALVERNITVVTGLARGIDTAATIAAIENGGRVIGVIGTPIDRSYPKENKGLQLEVATNHLLISQVPIFRYDHQPFKTQRYYFPERNVTMAALCDTTIIVEAGETSGTRAQAKACIEQGKKLIFLRAVIETVSWAQAYVDAGALIANNVSDVINYVVG